MTLQRIDSTRGLRKSGQVLITIAMASTMLIALAGLAVDLVLAYAVKTFLSTAADSAAMGGSRALERGVTYEDQASEIERVTSMLFAANFPSGLLLTGNSGKLSQQVTIAGSNMDPAAPAMFEEDPSLEPGLREVRVIAEALAPTFFMRIFGVDSVPIRAGARAARRDVNVVVIIDRSGSLKKAGVWGEVQAAAASFIEKFDNNRDRIGVVTFGSNANIDIPLATGFKTNDAAKNVIMSQTIPDAAATNAAQGMWLAYSELLRVNDPNALNVIVFFTDGQPSGFTAKFNTRLLPLNLGGPRCNSFVKEAAVATVQNNLSWNVFEFRDMMGFWKPEAGPAPVRSGATDRDYELVDGCSGFADADARNVEQLFDPIALLPTKWQADRPGVATKTFCILPGALGCLGDDGNFPYSFLDIRLLSISNTLSELLFRGTNVHNGAKNLLLNIAQTARRDASLGGVYIHSIGLGGYGYDADAALLKRVANDPSNSYGVTITAAADEPQGSYIYSPSAGDLNEAFNKVRSQVLRLTK